MRRRRISRFRVFAAVYVTVIILAVAAALTALWCFLAEYERTLPVHTAEDFARSLDGEEISDLIDADTALVPEVPDAFETRETAVEALAGSASDLEYSISRDVRASTEKSPVYIIKAGGAPLCSVTLSEGAEGMFGLRGWNVAAVSLIADFFSAPKREVTVNAPEKAVVCVNGVALGGDYTTGSSEYAGLNEFESGRTGAPRSAEYHVGGLYAQPSVTAELDGTALTAAEEKGAYYFAYPESASHTVTVTVPSGCSVTINGVPLGDDRLTDYREPYPDLTEFESADKFFDVRYAIAGFYSEPEVSATLNGAALDRAGKEPWSFGFTVPPALTYAARISAPDGAAVLVNGVAVSEKYMTDVSGYPCLEGLGDFVGELPSARNYEIAGLYGKPEITASDTGLSVSETTESGEGGTTVSCVFASRPDEAVCAELEAAALAFVRAYVYYNAQGYVNIDENYKAVKDLLLPGTETAELIAQSYWAVTWNANYDYIEYSKLEALNYIVYSDGLYSCGVSFALEQRRYHFVRDYDETYTLVFFRTSDGLRIANVIFNQ